MSCLTHAAQLGRESKRLRELGAEVVGIGPSSPRAAERTRSFLKLKYPLLGDKRAELYRYFGFTRALGIIQRSGAVVIDRDGVIRFIHRTANPSAALPMDAIVEALTTIG